MITDEHRARVAAGASWLDSQIPGWEEQVRADLLRMDNADLCVLGQVFGSYWDAPPWDGLSLYFDRATSAWHEVDDWCTAHGFQCRLDPLSPDRRHDPDDCEPLGEAWIELLNKRDAAVPAGV